MKIKLIVLALIFNLSHLVYFSQLNNNLIVKSDDSVDFFIFVDDILQNSYAFDNIKLSGYDKASMKLKIYIPDSSKQIIEKSIYFEQTNRETSAKLIFSSGEYKFRFTGDVPIGVNAMDTTQLIVPYHTSSLFLDSLFLTDSTHFSDTTFHNLAKSESYSGKIGCSGPLNSTAQLFENINKEYFSSNKLALAKKELPKGCFTVNEIKKIISLFEYDDQKLELSMLSFNYIYDVENFKKLENLFLLQSSLDKFYAFINENVQLDKN